ncbi:ergothioneine biosynthesis protein EgtC [Amycolatopsis sp. H20-H5]|uniref:ergothioneine biosynthesis protein EgtC n=1 Tax=Amycolatopsis sp. H20-H5 TaxID=3046309 RepID=UPI002DB56C56|nr:ergothioneine biosynthesis protein EgtC [Amycolatopsis sp. H20-H5]MEC3979986.1 ergothioneine biosynthesis protein EgtC [Amycolatopsis sp. H20-H5]
MCRHLAYLGAPCSPAGFLFHAPHSLLVQSYAPADMRGGGSVNADGFGLGWYAGGPEPLRYRRVAPLWTDDALPAIAGSVRTHAFVAAIRNGTTGMPVMEQACAPFTDGRWLFSHNGVVRGWPESVAELASKLPVTDLLTLDAPTDSALLWALLRDRLRAGEEPLEAVAELVLAVERAAPGSRLNLLLTDGASLLATAWTHSLAVCETAEGVLVASEPGDPGPHWRPVPDRHAVRVAGGIVEFLSLESPLENPEPDRSTRAS